MTRARRSLAILTLLAGLVACNADTGTVVYVTLRPRLATHTPATIHIVVANAGGSATRDFPLTAGQRLPLSFTITPTGRTGTLHIDATATFADGQPAGRGSLDVAIVPDKEVDADLVVEPDDFVVNKATPGAQVLVFDVPRSGRQVAVAPDGGFVVSFENDCGSLGRCDVLARLFDKTATPAKNQTSLDDGDLILNQAPIYAETPAIAAGKNGYLAAWVAQATGRTDGDVRATVLGFDGGHLQGADIEVSTAVEDDLGPTVFALTDGSFVVTWERTRASGSTREIRARLYSAEGVALENGVTHDTSDFAVSAATNVNQVDAHGAGLAGGGFVIVWVTGGNVQARVFGADGTPATPDVALTSYAGAAVDGPHVAATREGFVVAWRPSGGPFGQRPVLAQRFSPTASSLSTPIAVAAHTVDLLSPIASIATPSLTVRTSDGAIGVSWASCADTGDGDGCGVFFRLLRPSGQPMDEPGVVDTTTKGDQTAPSVAAGADDGFLVAWTDASGKLGDESDSGVRARVVYPSLDRHDGTLGALCGATADAPCLEGTTCQDDADGVSICHAQCTDSCPGGGTCVNATFCAFQ